MISTPAQAAAGGLPSWQPPSGQIVCRRVSIDAAASGAKNMSRDRLLLEQAESSTDLVTVVRLYRWSRPTVSLGLHQDPAQAIDLPYCERNEIEWVRRPTGGRAVFHDQELTYAVVSNDPHLFPSGSISATYRLVSQILARGLGALGGAVSLQRRRSSVVQRGVPINPCFATAARHELLFQGRKLVGSAQRRLRRSFLQHGSIPVRLDYRRQARVLKFDAERLRSTLTCWGEVSSSQNPVEDLSGALLQAFARYLGLLSTSPGRSALNQNPSASEGRAVAAACARGFHEKANLCQATWCVLSILHSDPTSVGSVEGVLDSRASIRTLGDPFL